ncbi:MAG: LPS-assembly protein LptD [Turneriella sp.]|nr:LPS-assembly protein LptD [Turneriella sp.]
MQRRIFSILRVSALVGIFFLFVPFARLFAAPLKETPQNSIEILRASEAEYVTVAEGTEGVFILRGGIIVRSGDVILRAETIKMNTKTGEIFGEGRVSFESGTTRLQGEKFYYDNNHGAGVVYSSKAVADPFYISGSTIKQVEPNRYIARDAFFTSCNEKYPHYYFKAKKLWLYKNNEIAAISAVYYVGHTPIFYWPLILKSDIGTGIITQYGNNLTKGNFFQNTWRFSNPLEEDSAWQPRSGKIMFDWYEKTGYLLGINLLKDTSALKYNINTSIANFKAREITPDGNITNQVRQLDGSYGTTQFFWYKIKADIKTTMKRSEKDDSALSAYVRFEHYKHRNFEMEFGERYEPDMTLNALYRPRFNQLSIQKNLLNWETGIAYTRKDTQLQVRAQRQLLWYQADPDSKSKYSPIYDMAPEITFSNRTFLLRGNEGMFRGIMNTVNLNAQLSQQYKDITATPVRQFLRNEGYDQVSFYFSLLPWINFIPSAGVGLLYSYSSQNDALLQKELARQSYAYLFTNDTLRIGYPFFYAQAIYTQRYSFADQGMDLTFGHNRMQAVTTSLMSDLNPYASFSLMATRDLRAYPYPILEQERWSDLVARTEANYDFIRGFTVNLYGLSQRKYNHFNGLGILDAAAYSIQYDTMKTNDFQFYYRVGGYRLPLLRELSMFKVTSTYRHNFINIAESSLRLGFETDILVHNLWRLRLSINSLADQFERYQTKSPAYVPFFDDFVESLNPFSEKSRKDRILNLESYAVGIEHDLHRWLFRLTFSARRRTIYTGAALRDRLSFLEQTIYISFTLKDLDGFGLPYTELYRYNPTDAGIR